MLKRSLAELSKFYTKRGIFLWKKIIQSGKKGDILKEAKYP